MQIKWLGAILTVSVCGGFGFSMALKHKREERDLRDFIHMVQTMQWELQYHVIPLPELCLYAAKKAHGVIKKTMENMARELDLQILPDAESCMWTAICSNVDISRRIHTLFALLGQSLGRFDLTSQVQGLEMVQMAAMEELEALRRNRDVQLRNYQTLGLCTGIALVILFI